MELIKCHFGRQILQFFGLWATNFVLILVDFAAPGSLWDPSFDFLLLLEIFIQILNWSGGSPHVSGPVWDVPLSWRMGKIVEVPNPMFTLGEIEVFKNLLKEQSSLADESR